MKESKRKELEETKSVDDPEFLIRESKHNEEPKRMFVPDFDENEVPPLE